MARTDADPAVDRRPLPAPDEVTGFFWEGAAAGRLMMQRCQSCRHLQFPPDVSCLECQSQDFDHVEVSGRGILASFAHVDRPLHVGFVDRLPYTVALVELDEQPGLRMIANLVDIPDGASLECGTPVEVTFERRGEVTLPQFRLVGGGS